MSVTPAPERARKVRLTHSKCGTHFDVATTPSKPDEWPKHKCSKTNTVEPFDWWSEVPKVIARELPPEVQAMIG